MNRWTLTFINQALEDSYQNHSSEEMKVQIQQLLKKYFIVLFGFIAASLENKDYAIFGLSAGLMFSLILVLFNWSKIQTTHIIFIYNMGMCVGPQVFWAAIFITNFNTAIKMNLVLTQIAFPSVFIKSNNIIMASLQMMHYYIMCVIYVNHLIGFSIYTFTWLPMGFLWINNYYMKLKNERELFKRSQINDSICNVFINLDSLIQQTSKEDIIIFNFNKEVSRYEIECTNISQLDLPQYLAQLHLSGSNIDFSSYLFNKFISTQQRLDNKEIINGYQKQTRHQLRTIELYVQTYPKLKFCIKVMINSPKLKLKSLFAEHDLFNRYFQKIQKASQLQQYSLIHLLTQQLKIVKNIIRTHFMLIRYKIHLQYFDLNHFLYNIASELGLKVEIKKNSFICTDILLLSNILMGVYMIIKKSQSKIQIAIKNENENVRLIFNTYMSLKTLQRLTKSSFVKQLNDIHQKLSYEQIIYNQQEIILSIINNPELPFVGN